jgi:hypothetical protein
MLSVSVLQQVIDRAAFQHWQYNGILPTLTSGTNFWGHIKDEDIVVVEELIEGVANTDEWVSGTSRLEKFNYTDLIANLETHARANGYSSLDDWTSGLVCQGQLQIDEGFNDIYKACRVGRSPSELTAKTYVISGTRVLHV